MWTTVTFVEDGFWFLSLQAGCRWEALAGERPAHGSVPTALETRMFLDPCMVVLTHRHKVVTLFF